MTFLKNRVFHSYFPNYFKISVERLSAVQASWWLLLDFTKQWILLLKSIAFAFNFLLLNASLRVMSVQFNRSQTHVYLYFREQTNKSLDRSIKCSFALPQSLMKTCEGVQFSKVAGVKC